MARSARRGGACAPIWNTASGGRATGEIRWLRNTGFPLFGDNGAVRQIGGVSRDITDERAVANKTLRGSATLDDFAERFRGRLDALARVQGLLSRLS